MAETDSLLKRLVGTFILDFATWLLRTHVRAARPLQSELPGTTVAVDQVFQVTLADNREIVFHMEFQGRRSHEPMPWRMLDYMPRLASTYHLPLESVVLYIGRGAGADDTGLYHVEGLDGTAVLSWRYRVIRLWQMPAEELLAVEPVAPLVLVGQTQIAQPEVILPTVVTRLRHVTDIELRSRLFTALLALLPEEEMITMVERWLEHEDLVMELPYLQRIREEGRQEGHQEGHQEGRREGEAEMLLRLLHIRFGNLPTDTVARVHAAAPETLLHWSERVLTATTLDEVFAA
jgi:predicted transposase YdaD